MVVGCQLDLTRDHGQTDKENYRNSYDEINAKCNYCLVDENVPDMIVRCQLDLTRGHDQTGKEDYRNSYVKRCEMQLMPCR